MHRYGHTKTYHVWSGCLPKTLEACNGVVLDGVRTARPKCAEESRDRHSI